MDPENALKTLLKEYPFLDSAATKIIKQFVAADGRVYNSFIVESTGTKFKKFVAKSFVRNPESLKREWVILRMLQDRGAHAPKLLVGDHEPKHFLLIEFIDGIPASQAVQQEQYDIGEIFKGIGEATGITNSIELDTFGDILEHSTQSWKDQVLQKLNEKLQVVTQHIKEEDFLAKLMQTIEDTKHVLEEETKGKPALVHHDIYLENFLVKKTTKEVILIDYGIAYGGRPLFDLAKFYIWDLMRYPEQKDTFLQAYSTYVPIPENFNEVMRFYLLYECFGMIAYFDRTGASKERDDTIEVLKDLVNKEGVITKLLQ